VWIILKFSNIYQQFFSPTMAAKSTSERTKKWRQTKKKSPEWREKENKRRRVAFQLKARPKALVLSSWVDGATGIGIGIYFADLLKVKLTCLTFLEEFSEGEEEEDDSIAMADIVFVILYPGSLSRTSNFDFKRLDKVASEQKRIYTLLVDGGVSEILETNEEITTTMVKLMEEAIKINCRDYTDGLESLQKLVLKNILEDKRGRRKKIPKHSNPGSPVPLPSQSLVPGEGEGSSADERSSGEELFELFEDPPTTSQALLDPPTTSQALLDPPTTSQAPLDPPTTSQAPLDPPTTSRAPPDPPTTSRAQLDPPTTSGAPLVVWEEFCPEPSPPPTKRLRKK
jgi:hypothetical protein